MSTFVAPNLSRVLQRQLFETRTRLLLTNAYLQVLDVLTTIAVLVRGGIEANPLARLAIQVAPNPLLGLVGIKLAALGLALYCWRTHRLRALRFVNGFYALVIVWNLLGLVAACALA
jgi:hypothetical protein